MIWRKPARWRPRAGPGENASRCLSRTLRRQAKRLARRGASWKLRLVNQAIWTPLSLAVEIAGPRGTSPRDAGDDGGFAQRSDRPDRGFAHRYDQRSGVATERIGEVPEPEGCA